MLGDDIIIHGRRAYARSYAKINLTLDIVGKREDEYHNVDMIMQTVSLCDTLTVDKTYHDISVKTNLRYLPNNEQNIAYKAAVKFMRYTGIKGGAKIFLHKRIPVAAGLAGGSGNGAAVLCALNLLYDAGLSAEELCTLAMTLGADVPYCIKGGTQRAEGIGELLTPVSPLPISWILLVKPPVSVSTRAIYSAMDSADVLKRPDTAKMLSALADGDIKRVSSELCNVMESVTEAMHPQITGIKKKLIADGALGAVMSGSGPTVFGIFDDYTSAKKSADGFSRQFRDVYLVRPKA